MLNVKHVLLSFCILIFFVLILLSYFIALEYTQDTVVYFLDVGQGDASLIKTTDGKTVVIDGGPSNALIYKLGEYLPFYDRTIDLMILTHPDSDHLVGLIEVLKRYKVQYILMSGVNDDLPAYAEFLNIIKKQSIPVLLSRDVRVIPVNEKLSLDILYPDFLTTSLSGNESSLILKLNSNNNSVLFMGDAPNEVEKELVDKSLIGKVGTLKVGHHGSNTSSGIEFLSIVNPDLAVISVGENRYGHPDKRVLKRLQDLSIPFLTTWLEGDIIIPLP